MEVLQKTKEFEGLKEEDLSLLLKHMAKRDLKPHTTIAEQGERATCFFIVERGTLEKVRN
tara:strand:- start:2266 stop:2445 length:180 start_codon:yes stop_codon:yes gene_type:complete